MATQAHSHAAVRLPRGAALDVWVRTCGSGAVPARGQESCSYMELPWRSLEVLAQTLQAPQKIPGPQ